LGLAIARGIIEAHGGAIFLDSHYTSGAKFVVELPRAPSESALYASANSTNASDE
jgi:signal transduction histidine kinase